MGQGKGAQTEQPQQLVFLCNFPFTKDSRMCASKSKSSAKTTSKAASHAEETAATENTVFAAEESSEAEEGTLVPLFVLGVSMAATLGMVLMAVLRLRSRASTLSSPLL